MIRGETQAERLAEQLLGNEVPPQALAAWMEMSVNPTEFTNVKVRTSFIEISQAITLKAQSMTALAEQQGVPRENPLASNMANKLKDYTRMNPLFILYLRQLIVSRRNVVQLCYMRAWNFQGLWSVSNISRKKRRGRILGQGTVQGKLRRFFQGRVLLK